MNLFQRGYLRLFLFFFLWISQWYTLFFYRNLWRVQHWSWGAVLDEIQHLSAAGCGDFLCSGGTSQHGDGVCSQLCLWREPKLLNLFPQNILLCESQRHIWFIKHVSKNVVYYKIRLWLSQTTVRKNNCWMALQGCRSMHFSGWRHLTSILSLSVTAQLVVVLSENQPSPLLTAQISECCSISCTWWWKRYNRMTQLTSLNGKSSGKLSEQN